MRKNIFTTSMAVALCALAACSKQDGQAGSGSSSSSPSANGSGGSISLLNIYSIPLNGGAYLLTELENNGKTGIKAFQGKWTMTDDLDAKVADDTIRFTSETQVVTTNGLAAAHVIAPGDKFVVVEQSVTGQPDNVFVVANKDDLAGMSPIFQMLLKEKTWEQLRAKKKTTFKIEKIVSR